MKTKLFMLAAATALLSVSCAKDEMVKGNPDPAGSAITFTPTVGRQTRATEIDIKNLGDFGVWARAIERASGELYASFLIGDQNDPEIASRTSLNTEETEGYWALKRNVYWPSDVNTVLFWGMTTLQNNMSTTDVMDGNGTLSFVNNSPKLTGFSPRKASRENATNYQDGTRQQDLLTTFKAVSKDSEHNTTKVSLDFKHALSQIDIQAKEGDGQPAENRRVQIKGAWLVNARSQGDLMSSFNIKNTITEKPEWSDPLRNPVAYGSLFETPIMLQKSPRSIIGPTGAGKLMLIPQKVDKWDGNPAEETTTTTNAYILLLCRIDLVHTGAVHGAGETTTDTDDQHYHQLFPASETYDETQFGYTCVPIGIEWEPGKRYTYTLNICGASSGAGVYPPELPDDVPTGNGVTPTPGDKKPGEPVLDDPITFTVTVSSWDDDGKWTEGNTDGEVNM